MSLKNRIVNGAKWTSLSSIISISLHFTQLIILARILDPEAFGLIAMIMVVIGFSNIFADLGVSNAIIYKDNPTSNQLSSLYWLNIFGGILIYLVLILITPLIANFFKEPQLESLMYLAAFTFLITPFGQQFQILLQKELEFEKLAKLEVVTSFAKTLITIILAFIGFGVISLVWGQLASALIKTLLLVFTSWKKWHPKLRFVKEDLKGFIGFGMYQLGDRALAYFKGNIDTILIGRLLGSEALGLYNIAFNIIIVPVSKINPILTKIAFPVFSKIKNDHSKLKTGYLQLVNLLSFVNAPIFFGIALTSAMFVPIIFGQEWERSIIIVQILAGVGLLRSIANPVGSLLLSKGRADIGFNLSVIKVIAQVITAFIGIKLGGLIGISIAYIILQLLFSLLDYRFVIRSILGKCAKEYLTVILTPVFLAVIMYYSINLITTYIVMLNDFYNLLLQIILGILLYTLLAFVFRSKFTFFNFITNK